MTIAAVSETYGLTPDTLRYYERIGLIPPVPRTAGGIRDYGEDDLRMFAVLSLKETSPGNFEGTGQGC